MGYAEQEAEGPRTQAKIKELEAELMKVKAGKVDEMFGYDKKINDLEDRLRAAEVAMNWVHGVGRDSYSRGFLFDSIRDYQKKYAVEEF